MSAAVLRYLPSAARFVVIVRVLASLTVFTACFPPSRRTAKGAIWYGGQAAVPSAHFLNEEASCPRAARALVS